MNNTSRVFAVLPPAETTDGEKQQGLEPRAAKSLRREVQVTGVAEASSPADRASVRFKVTNSKESASEVASSVTRRLDYIIQVLRQYGVSGDDTLVRKFLRRDADTYHMDAEVVVTFSDFEKMEQIRSILLEKLDKSVCVGAPQFYHSPDCLGQIRQSACVSAVENAQQKASRISQLLGQSLGTPLLVREETTKEWRKEEEEEHSAPHIPVVTASSHVSVSFSFRDNKRQQTQRVCLN